MEEDLSKPAGCYGIKSVEGFAVFIDQWHANGGDPDGLQGTVMIINTSTRAFSMWIEEIFYNER
jgi:hypothetical protein